MQIPSLEELLGKFKDNHNDESPTHFKQMVNDLLQVVYLLAPRNSEKTIGILTLIKKYIIVLTLDSRFREKEFAEADTFNTYDLDYPRYISDAYKNLQEQLRTNTIFSQPI